MLSIVSAPSPSWLANLGGRFVVFDGPDGCGKTTQCRRFSQFAERAGLTVCPVREPGGTQIGEQIRHALLDAAANEKMDVMCEMLLFMGSRAQLVAQKIKPALSAGHLVLADRFISSTLSYQGAAGGVPVKDILTLGKIALGGCQPDLVTIFDIDEETASARLDPHPDRMERKGAAFHRKVRQGFLDQADADPDRYLVIDAAMDVETVFQSVLKGLETWFTNR